MTKAAPAPLVLESPRLRLRPWRPEDLAPLAAMQADPAVMRHFPAPLSRAESDAWAARLTAHMDRHGWGFWAVERRAAPGLVGVVGLLHLAWEPPWDLGHTPVVERMVFMTCSLLLTGFPDNGDLGLGRRRFMVPDWHPTFWLECSSLFGCLR